MLEEAGDADPGVVGAEHLDERRPARSPARRRADRTGRRRSPAWSARCASSAPPATSAASASARSCSSSVRHHLVGQPDAQRLLGAHLTAGEAHLLGPAGPDRARQTLRAAATRDDPEQDLRLAEHRLVRDDPVVAGQRQLAPAAERVAADRGDDEPRDRGDGVERGVEPGGDRRRLVRPAELGDVGAGGEDPLAAGDDDARRADRPSASSAAAAARRAAPTTAR